MLANKINTLSGIPENAIKQLDKYLKYIHSHDIVLQMDKGENVFELELFEGTLYLTLDDSSVKYKFVPNKEFEDIVVQSIINKSDKLLNAATDKLKLILSHTYKDIL